MIVIDYCFSPIMNLQCITAVECDWPETPANKRRRVFCSQYEGYGAVCNCAAPLPLDTKAPDVSAINCQDSPPPQLIIISFLQFPNNNVRDVPVAVVASNRPHYLFSVRAYAYVCACVCVCVCTCTCTHMSVCGEGEEGEREKVN